MISSSTAALLLARAHYPVTALGPGVRAGIWTQGCTIGCAGCLSRDTWDADAGSAVPVGAVLGWLASLPQPVDGVTISGGEPFEQPGALAELLHGITTWRGTNPVDILVYSGRVFSRLTRSAESREILKMCDAVVAGPYVDRLNAGAPLKGSANQQIVPLTALGHQRYDALVDGDGASGDLAARVQVSVDEGTEGRRVYYIGIPRRGDMAVLERAMTRAGVRAREVSWRP
ncbi:MAG: putative radical activating enzyme [Streptosporangiaceae bacterium]|nr:putative radical activating enzyme [Streptosporangiaceae bacterium]